MKGKPALYAVFRFHSCRLNYCLKAIFRRKEALTHPRRAASYCGTFPCLIQRCSPPTRSFAAPSCSPRKPRTPAPGASGIPGSSLAKAASDHQPESQPKPTFSGRCKPKNRRARAGQASRPPRIFLRKEGRQAWGRQKKKKIKKKQFYARNIRGTKD